jgi:hypothetical protein
MELSRNWSPFLTVGERRRRPELAGGETPRRFFATVEVTA